MHSVKAKLVVDSGSVVVLPDVGITDIFTSRTLIDSFSQLLNTCLRGGNHATALPNEGFTQTRFSDSFEVCESLLLERLVVSVLP